ncbi:MAG TPA: carboxypeptidase regulatory-like domain-containing protein [Terriglobia bacterium]|nr:carboxypeptidase regulatory-like domain-containing protein [Terriglobia bacterium]
MHRRLWWIGAALFLSLNAYGQADRGSLTGTVHDSSGLVVPGATVVAVQDATGLTRTTVTSQSGAYSVPELPVGIYTATVALKGFQTVKFENVEIGLEHTTTLNVDLRVSSAGTERVEVVGSAQQLDENSNALGTNIELKQVKELPLDGRDWATLTTMIPSAVDAAGGPGAGNQRSIRYAGRGRDDDNYTYDGIDSTYVINQSQLYFVRLAVPLDTIDEIRVDPMLATAQTGETAGAQLALASPTGTNGFHGDAYEYLRNDVFDALDPLDALNPTHRPPFHLNQFGGTLGGPIQKDKTFFFAAYEGYRQDLGQTLGGYVPTAAFSAQVLAKSPALTPVIDAYPQGQIATSNPDVAQFVGAGRQNGLEDSEMLRLDHRFSEATNLFVRASNDRAIYYLPYSPSTGQYLNEQEELKSYPVNTVIALSHVFSPTLINETKLGFNRGTTDTVYLNPTGSLDAISTSGLFTTLNNGRVSTGVGNTFAGIDDLTWVKGRHVIKAGVEVRRVQMNQGSSTYGTVTFSSLAGFAADQPSKASITGTYPVNGLRKTDFFSYFQDEFKWRPNLTLNLGVRYTFFGIFSEEYRRGNPFDFATCGPAGYCGVGSSFGPGNYADVDPRLAFAWAPAVFGGKTVIRSGFGIYHEDGQLDDQNLPDKNEVLSYALTPKNCLGLTFPVLVSPAGVPLCGSPAIPTSQGTQSPNAEERDRKDTYVDQWGLSVQQALPGNFLASLSYVGSLGRHLLQESYVNVENLVTGLRPYPAFSQIGWRGTIGDSNYEALSLSLKRTFSRGLLTSANYTWAHEIDNDSNGSGDGDSITPQNVSCQPSGAPACGEYSSGAFDVRHAFNANAIYELPFGPGKAFLNQAGALRAILGSWSLGTNFVARTGYPVDLTTSATGPDGNSNEQRPNIVPGQSFYLAGGNFNPAAFCTPGTGDPLYPGGACPPGLGISGFGDVPRNFLRGPGVWQLDFALSKRIPVKERLQLQFRAEAFNLFNRGMYANPDGLVGASDFGIIHSLLNTTPVGMGTQRQLQFSLRLQF